MLKIGTQVKTILKKARCGLRVYHDRMRLHDSRYPPEVWIENTNCCNASCSMCPRDKLTRKQGFMTFELFAKLVDEIALFPEPIRRLHVHNYGEPLLDRELAHRVRYAKEKGIRHVYFVSNGSLLTRALSAELIDAGLDELKISFYGTDATTYNATMSGLDFDITMRNIRDFIDARKQMSSSKPALILQYLPQDSNCTKTEDFYRLFEGVIQPEKGDCLNMFSLHNYGGGREFNKLPKKVQSICDYPWRTMVILHSGDVVLCCLDFNGVQVIGNVLNSSIEEVWLGERMKNAKKKFKQLDYSAFPTCLRCERIR